MSNVCTWPSCKCTAKGQCEGLGHRILAHTFTAADLERAWGMGRDVCIGILECELELELELARAADRTTALVLAITCHAMNGETPPVDLAQRVKGPEHD